MQFETDNGISELCQRYTEADVHREKPVGWPPTRPCLGQVALFEGLSGPELADPETGLQHRVLGVEGIRGGGSWLPDGTLVGIRL